LKTDMPSAVMAKRKASPAKIAEDTPAAVEEYTVLARRYRPQQFSDLVGQEPVAQALTNALASNRVAHAYLFTGARGVGKTSTARILAKALNCVKGPTATPCDECDLCRSIASGDDMDVLEIDGASNRGIDEVREIRQNVQYRPSRARCKIYIIDEVHMLTPPAFNALLKTLEEPPPHVKFIFATTEAQKIPITILSRCQRFDFAGIGTQRIVQCLRAIVARENLKADDEALELVARRAAGSMRDAQSLLDQLLAFGGERLTTDQVHALLGTAHEERVAEIATAVLDADPRRALELLARAADEGLQLGEFFDQLIDYWRDLMVVHSSGLENQVLSQTGDHKEALLKQAQTQELDTILAGLDILVSAKTRMRSTAHGRVVLEMALVRLSRLDKLVSLAQLAEALGRPPGQGQGSSAQGNTSPRLPRPQASRTIEPAESQKKKAGAESVAGVIPLSEETLTAVWQRVMESVGPMQAAILGKIGNVAIFGPNTLVLRFPSSYNQVESHYLDPTRVARIEDLLRQITGQACIVRLDASKADTPPPDGSAAEDTETSLSRTRRQRAEAARQPLVTRAMEVLGAQIVQMDDGFGAALVSAPARPDVPGSDLAGSDLAGSDLAGSDGADSEES
jgi:DNA polymerase-3 subunit gamma/tau